MKSETLVKIVRVKGGQRMVWVKERGKVQLYAHPLDLLESIYRAELMWFGEVFRRCGVPFSPSRFIYAASAHSSRDHKLGYDKPKYHPGYRKILEDGIWTFYRKPKKRPGS